MSADDPLSRMQDVIREFCEARDWDQFHGPKDLAIGLVTEASELLELFRFKNDAEIVAWMQSEDGKSRVREELADTLFFVLRFAQRNGVDLEAAFGDKMEKNAKRYPVETARGSNLKAAALDEG